MIFQKFFNNLTYGVLLLIVSLFGLMDKQGLYVFILFFASLLLIMTGILEHKKCYNKKLYRTLGTIIVLLALVGTYFTFSDREDVISLVLAGALIVIMVLAVIKPPKTLESPQKEVEY